MVESYAAEVDSLNKIDDLGKQLQDQGQREQKSKSNAAATAGSPMAKVENKNVVLVYPKKKMCSKEVKRQLQKVIQPAKQDIGVKRVRKVNHGSVMMECLREGEAQ